MADEEGMDPQGTPRNWRPLIIAVIAMVVVGLAGWFYWQHEKTQDLSFSLGLTNLNQKTARTDSLLNTRIDSLGDEMRQLPLDYSHRDDNILEQMAGIDSASTLILSLKGTNDISALAKADTAINWIQDIKSVKNPFEVNINPFYHFGLKHPEVISAIWQKCRQGMLAAAKALSDENKVKAIARLQDIANVLAGRFDAKLISLIRESNPRLIKARQDSDDWYMESSGIVGNENDSIKTKTGATYNQVYQARLYVDLKDQFPTSIPILAGITNELLTTLGGKAVAAPAESGSKKGAPAKAGAKNNKFRIHF